MNIILIGVSFVFLGWEDTRGTILGSILVPIFMSLTSNISLLIDVSDVDFAVEELVGRKFTFNIVGSIKCLESEEDFVKQFNSNDCGPNAGLLNAFPASYINKWKKMKGFDSRMEKMIKNKFEELGWKYVSFRWNGSVTKGWKYIGDDKERTDVNGTQIDLFSV